MRSMDAAVGLDRRVAADTTTSLELCWCRECCIRRTRIVMMMNTIMVLMKGGTVTGTVLKTAFSSTGRMYFAITCSRFGRIWSDPALVVQRIDMIACRRTLDFFFAHQDGGVVQQRLISFVMMNNARPQAHRVFLVQREISRCDMLITAGLFCSIMDLLLGR